MIELHEKHPEIAAYFVDESIKLLERQEVEIETQTELEEWIQHNWQEICQLVRIRMDKLWSTIVMNMPEIAEMMSDMVYHEIVTLQGPMKPRWNPNYVEYAREHGKTPDEMIESESSMVNYLCWVGRRRND